MTPEERRAKAVRFLWRPENQHLGHLWDKVVFDLTDPDEREWFAAQYKAEWTRLKTEYATFMAKAARRANRGHNADEQAVIEAHEEALPYLDRLTVLSQLLPLYEQGIDLPYSRETLRMSVPGSTVVQLFGSETPGETGGVTKTQIHTGDEVMPAWRSPEGWTAPNSDELVPLPPDVRERRPAGTSRQLGQNTVGGPALSQTVPDPVLKAANTSRRRPLRDQTRDRFVDAAFLFSSGLEIKSLNKLNDLLLEIAGAYSGNLTKALADHVGFRPTCESFQSDFIPRVLEVAESYGFKPEAAEPASAKAKEVVKQRL